MCQPKSLGGKRCAIHHHGTQAAVQTTSVKTGVDTEDVKTVFSELNKEGKKLPEPSRAEYESYIEKERFLTEIDKTIPERDKNMILKKLNKAKEENTPSGGTFHAWKNLMSSTLQKFGKKTKLFVAGLGVAAIAFGSSGCAGVIPSQGTNSNTINGGTSISIVQGEQVIDALGTYSKVQIDSSNPAFVFDKTADYADMESITANGFTETDAAAAQKAVVTFVSTEMIDNNALDIPANADQVRENIKNTYGLSGRQDPRLFDSSSKIIYVQPDGITFARDGQTRILSNTTKINSVSGQNISGMSYVIVTGQTSVDYKPNSKANKTTQLLANWVYSVMPDTDGQWKIVGYDNSYQTYLK